MWLVKLALRNPYTMGVVAALLFLLGGLCIFSMNVDVFPLIDIPVVNVLWNYTGMQTEDLENRVIFQAERGYTTTVNGISRMESRAIPGTGLIRIYLERGVDIGAAISQITSSSMTSLRAMPPGMQPPVVIQFNASNVPVAQLSMTSDTIPEEQLFDYAQNFVRMRLFNLPGLSTPAPYGGRNRQINVDVQPERLTARGLSPQDVVETLGASNIVIPAGEARIGKLDYSVQLNSSPLEVADFNQLPVRSQNGQTVTLGEVAHVSDSFADQTSLVRLNGMRATFLNILKKADASTLAVVNELRDTLTEIRATAPKGMKFSIDFDQSVFVRAAVRNVFTEAAIATVLVSLMILVFLGSFRSVFIVCTSIPLSILASVICLKLCGQTLNIMTPRWPLPRDRHAGGRRHRGGGEYPPQPGRGGRADAGHPARRQPSGAAGDHEHASDLPGLLAHHPPHRPGPLPLLPDGPLRDLRDARLLRALPHLGAHPRAPPSPSPSRPKSRGKHPETPKGRGMESPFRALERAPGREARAAARPLRRLAGLSPPGEALGLLRPSRRLPAEPRAPPLRDRPRLLPSCGRRIMKLHFRARSGLRIEETEKLVAKVEERIRHVVPAEQLTTVNSLVGVPIFYNLAFVPTDNVGQMDAEIQIQLSPEHRPTLDVQRAIRRDLTEHFPGAVFYFQPADIMSMVLNFGQTSTLDVQVEGQKIELTLPIAQRLREKIGKVPGAVDVHVRQIFDYPELFLNVDRVRAQRLASPRRTWPPTCSSRSPRARSMPELLPQSGKPRDLFRGGQGPAREDPVVGGPLPRADHGRPGRRGLPRARERSRLAARFFRAGFREQGPARARRGARQPRRPRDEADLRGSRPRERAACGGRNCGRRGARPRVRDQRYREDHRRPRPPAARRARVGAGAEPGDEHGFPAPGLGLILAIVLVYLLMVVLFQSWLDAFLVLTALPGAMIGIFWMLAITGTSINVVSLMGSIMAVGIATANAILMVSFANDLRVEQDLDPAGAALEAGQTRLRPVIMTALAMILGMLPMSLGLGEGGGQNAPLARAVIGGLLVATFVTLFVVPLLYAALRTQMPRKNAIRQELRKSEEEFEAEIEELQKHGGGRK